MGLVIYGGSFNPLHIAHMRLAIETLEALSCRVDRLEFVPCAAPPHKNASTLLPFALRVAMIEASLKDQAKMSCNPLEGERSGLSYTWDTLRAYQERHAPGELYFLVGSLDFAMLGEWRNGLDFPRMCHLVVARRGDFSLEDFEKQARAFWPGAAKAKVEEGGLASIEIPAGLDVLYAPLPYLDISASAIRKTWLEGKNVEYLLPKEALTLINDKKQDVLACWRDDS